MHVHSFILLQYVGNGCNVVKYMKKNSIHIVFKEYLNALFI
jgi:hypothetical protein